MKRRAWRSSVLRSSYCVTADWRRTACKTRIRNTEYEFEVANSSLLVSIPHAYNNHRRRTPPLPAPSRYGATRRSTAGTRPWRGRQSHALAGRAAAAAGAHGLCARSVGARQVGGAGRAEIGAYSEVVRGFAEALGLIPFVLAGHSMGGAIALEFALRYPARLAGLDPGRHGREVARGAGDLDGHPGRFPGHNRASGAVDAR